MRQRQLRDDPRDLRRFGAVRLQKLAPRRQVVEEVAHLDGGALGRADLDGRGHRAAVHANLRAALLPARARPQHEVRHRRDRRQRFAAKTEREDGRQIVGAADLAGRVPLDRQPRVLRHHPFAVVLDAHLFLAAELDVDRETPGAGVDRVLDQLLDDRGRTLDDLAGRDLVREVGGEAVILPMGGRSAKAFALRGSGSGTLPQSPTLTASAACAAARRATGTRYGEALT